MDVMAPQSVRLPIFHEWVRGPLSRGPYCRTPGWLWRQIHRVQMGYEWACPCGQWWRWDIDPVAQVAGFSHCEWVRCL